METLHVALPTSLSEFVRDQVVQRGYEDVTAYVEDLIRADAQQLSAKAALEIDVVEGLNSGASEPMTAENWQAVRDEVLRRAESRAAN